MREPTKMSRDPYKSHVILLHGIGRDESIMSKFNSQLLLHGYCPHNISYPSKTARIEALSEGVYQRIKPLLQQTEKPVHFIGHSLGGIVARYLVQSFEVERLGKVIQLAPPNKGSEVAEFLKRFSFYKKAFGPAGQQLGTKNNTFLESLLEPNYDIGVIAGDKSIDLLFSWFLLPGPNDGKVTVESTKLAGMRDHVIVHAAHPFIPNYLETINQALHFLELNKFKK